MNERMQKSEVLPLVRSMVRDRLLSSPSFRELPAEKRRQVANDTVNAFTYMLGGEDGTNVPGSVTLGGNAEAFAGPAPGGTPKPAANVARETRGGGLGTAARAGGEAYANLVAGVDFPAFVGGLIDGVFNSIVTTSIKQMEAYAEMVKNVSKSVDQYMKDNVSEDNARDYLADKYPDHLEIGADDENNKKVKVKQDADDSALPDFFADLGMKAPLPSLDDDAVEEQLVPAARRRIAMDRQQLLVTMIMMGINRLVVTNGTIEASCFFELDTTDTRKAHDQRTQMASNERTISSEKGGKGGSDYSGDWSHKKDDWKSSGKYSGNQSWYNKTNYNDVAKFNVTTSNTRDSEETIKMHAELGGKVKVNFKSDFFPMEKMVDVLQVNQIREKATAGVAPPAQPTSPALPPPALPPLPALPALPAPATAGPAPAR